MNSPALPQHHRPFAASYRQAGYWTDGPVVDHLRQWAAEIPQQIALVDRRGALSFQELDLLVDIASQGLIASGMQAGQVVAIQLPNWREFAFFQQAAIRAGGSYLPIPPQLRAGDLQYILNVSGAWGLVIPDHFRNFNYQAMASELRNNVPRLRQVFVAGAAEVANIAIDALLARPLEPAADAQRLARKRHADDVRQIIFTSGTESKPKGVVHSYNTSFFAFAAHQAKFGLSSVDSIFTCSTVGHATGAHFGVELGIYLGAKIVLQERWDPAAALELMREHECTMMWGAATFYNDLVQEALRGGNKPTRLRLACSAGAPIPRALIHSVKEALNATLVTAYGQSEGHNISISDLQDDEVRVSSTDGRVNTGIDFKLVDGSFDVVETGQPGEFVYRGPNVCLGYLEPEHMASAFDSDGFIRSGDLASVDSDRYLRIVGRRKEIIIRGGENISPLELEDVLYKHPAVMDAAVIATPDDRLGQKACAVVSLKPGGSLTLDELRRHFEQARVARYKTPEALLVIDEFPRTPSGKIKKALLHDLLSSSTS